MDEIIQAAGTATGAAVVAYWTKDGIEKLLGPTAAYLGEGLKNFTQKRAEAIGKIFSRANEKLGSEVDKPGQVAPKVLKMIVNEGSYADDPLAIEYFGGILASSRTELGRDDRGARLAKIADAMSNYQLRAHYLIYLAIKREFAADGLTFNMDGRDKMEIFIPFSSFNSSMEFAKSETQNLTRLYEHIFFGLNSDALIGNWIYGGAEDLRKHRRNLDCTEGGICCKPSSPGVELFLSALGMVNLPLESIFELDENAFATELMPAAFERVARVRYGQFGRTSSV